VIHEAGLTAFTAAMSSMPATSGSDLKATQKLLGHSSISTTGDIYADWDIDQLADTMRAVLEGE
jgi:site-specific recombinase XerC